MDLHLDVKIASLCWAVVQSRVVVPPTADRWRRGGAGWPGTHLGLHRAGRPPPATPRHQNKTDHSHHQHLASVSADITSHQPHCPCYVLCQPPNFHLRCSGHIMDHGRNYKTSLKSCMKTLSPPCSMQSITGGPSTDTSESMGSGCWLLCCNGSSAPSGGGRDSTSTSHNRSSLHIVHQTAAASPTSTCPTSVHQTQGLKTEKKCF